MNLRTKELGEIRLERLLGRGGMGVVWRGLSSKSLKRVAVKMLSPHLTRNSGAIARFQRESRILEKVRHAHIVKVLARGIKDSVPYVVMEHVEGATLAELIEKKGALSLEETRTVVLQILDALRAVHDAGVIHRDVKPANVMVRETEHGVDTMLIDFGVSVAAWEPALTDCGATVGTAHYMSPEQLFGQDAADFRSDLWGVAVLAYECLTGDVPFDGPTFGSICLALHEGRFTPCSALRRGLPVAVDQWFEKALSQDPDVRFGDAREMARAFSCALDGTEEEACPPSRTRRTRISGLSTTLDVRSAIRSWGQHASRAVVQRVALGA